MAYSDLLAGRIRDVLATQENIEEKKMFGGICFLLNGNMLVGVWKDSLIVRQGLDGYLEALKESFVKEFDITGKSMKGWLLVEHVGIEEDGQLLTWINRAMRFVKTLPRKK